MRKWGVDIEIPGADLAHPVRVALASLGHKAPTCGIALSLVECVDCQVQHRVHAFQGACIQRAQFRRWSACAEQRAQLPERVFERHQQSVPVAQGVSRLDLVGAPPYGQGVEKAPDVVKEAA